MNDPMGLFSYTPRVGDTVKVGGLKGKVTSVNAHEKTVQILTTNRTQIGPIDWKRLKKQ